MNKRYIDFVPAKKTAAKQSSAGSRQLVEQKTRQVTTAAGRSAVSKNTANRIATPLRAAKPSPKMVVRNAAKDGAWKRTSQTKAEAKPVLGVVEDLNQSFVQTEVPKRPLGKKEQSSKEELAWAKAQKVKNAKIATSKPVEKPVEKPTKADDSKVFRPPVTTFINQEKVVKRPLSRNVYQKSAPAKTASSKEIAKAPVTIIAKPDKDAGVSIIVTIIITIILGAAAGTVAFLLLPK